MRRDPFAQKPSQAGGHALQYFTDRTPYIEAFYTHLAAPATQEMQTLVFYGVGGIGKTTLVQKLCAELEEMRPPLPFARFNLENIADQAQSYREALLRLRADLETNFRIDFPHFDLGLAVVLAREGGEAPPMVQVSPHLQTAFHAALEFTPAIVKATTRMVGSELKTAIQKSGALEQWVRKVGGTEEVVGLNQRLLENDQAAQEELVRRFAQDLAQNLPERPGLSCRGVIFLDTYESLWTGRESGASAQARLLDEWVRTLAEYCLASGVLLVITGREQMNWAETDPDWEGLLDQRLMGGLSEDDAQEFLARRDIGSARGEKPTPLQTAMIRCANTAPSPADPTACHLLYLALCADIVVNTRETEGKEPDPQTFARVPSSKTASVLATRFLKSLHNRNMELWVEALSLTPRFDEAAALALDGERQYHNGRAGWEQMMRYSFVLAQPDGFYRMHRAMREALRMRCSEAAAQAQHGWFAGHWDERGEAALAFYHRWRLDPLAALTAWAAEHQEALDSLRVLRARSLLTGWAEVGLDDDDRTALDDALWGRTHAALGQALWRTPMAPRPLVLHRAAAHFRAALSVFPDETEAWAEASLGLALCLIHLPAPDPAPQLREAMECLNHALRVYTPETYPEPWANTQNHLGILWAKRPARDAEENADNKRRAIACFEATVQVWTEQTHPKIWARGQHNLGVSYFLLPGGDREANLRCAVDYLEAALRVRTRAEFPSGWALTQYNLGEVYRKMPGDREAHLGKARQYYEAALEVYTEEDFPETWAETMNSLGHSWREMPSGDMRRPLEQAILYYEAALRVWTEDDCPEDWGMVQESLRDARRRLAQS